MRRARYSRQPPTIAPSRLAPKAAVGSAVPAKRAANTMLAAMIGANVTTIAATRRAATGSCNRAELGTKAVTASDTARSEYDVSRDGGLGSRRVISTAASTPTRTPAKTRALTSQVVPKSSANRVTPRVSSSRKAAPSNARSAYGRNRAGRPPEKPTAAALTSRIPSRTSRYWDGVDGVSRYGNGRSSLTGAGAVLRSPAASALVSGREPGWTVEQSCSAASPPATIPPLVPPAMRPAHGGWPKAWLTVATYGSTSHDSR